MAGIIIKHFSGDRYSAAFNPNTGFFARIEDNDAPEPFWATHGPELIDVAITNWCDRDCSFCYRSSNRAGSHMPVADYVDIMRQARDMHVFQVALGGGNPNQHPAFSEILRITRDDFGIIPNYTTNGRGLTPEILDATAKHCGAVAVSAYAAYEEMSDAVHQLNAAGITTNLHFILSSQSVETAISWLKSPPPFLQGVHAIVFLNYKPAGRFSDTGMLLNRSSRMQEFFELVTHHQQNFRVGFDTCSITGLARFGNVPSVSIEGCDAGRFSLFVSEKSEAFPCSFMVDSGYQGVSLKGGKTLLEIWSEHPTFKRIRALHAKGSCSDCKTPQHCLSGCPIFPEMNLCPSKCSFCVE